MAYPYTFVPHLPFAYSIYRLIAWHIHVMPSACLYFLHCCYPWREVHTAWLTTDHLWNWKRDCSPPTGSYIGPQRRHGSTRVPGHAFLAWHSSWRTAVYVCYITSTGNSFSSQLLSGRPVQYGKGRRYGPSITYKITPTGSLSSSQPGGPPCWVSLHDKQRTMRISKSIEQRCSTGHLWTFCFMAWLVIVFSILDSSVPQGADPPSSKRSEGR